MVLGDFANLISAIVAVISAVLALKASREAKHDQKKAADALLKQNQLREREWAEQYFIDVRTWADEVCLHISEALHLSRYSCLASNEALRMGLETKLSCLLDTGRWYFPNHWSQDYGKEKEAAYRGIRQPILDYVYDAYNATVALKSEECSQRSLAKLVQSQRGFVSEVQKVLDPRRREQEVKRVLDEFNIAEKLRYSSN